MPFDPEHFLGLCKELASMQTAFTEASCRSVISRSYYSAHLYAREVLRRYFPTRLCKTGMDRLGQEHGIVVDCLAESGHYHISAKLDGLRIKRAKADYDLNAVWDSDVKKEANKAIELSNFIIEQIKASPLLRRT